MKTNIEPDIAKQSFIQMRPKYDSLNGLVRGILESLLEDAGIVPLSISGRTKTVDSFVEKIGRKDYSNPLAEMTDLCGLRVITFIESDVEKACEVIHKSFNVHPDKSPDKSSQLEVNQFGYRSKHFVCDLGKERGKIPEYSLFKGMLFEIQVRTVLQHAWAEIEHDRGYKFVGDLPPDVQRRLYIVAAALEGADRQFSDITRELDAYSAEISAKTKNGEFDIDLNSTSLFEYLQSVMPAEKLNRKRAVSSKLVNVLIQELKRFGVTTIADLDNLNSPEEKLTLREHHNSFVSYVRRAMMFSDLDRYFSKAWQGHWTRGTLDLVEALTTKYDRAKIDQVLQEHGVSIPNGSSSQSDT